MTDFNKLVEIVESCIDNDIDVMLSRQQEDIIANHDFSDNLELMFKLLKNFYINFVRSGHYDIETAKKLVKIRDFQFTWLVENYFVDEEFLTKFFKVKNINFQVTFAESSNFINKYSENFLQTYEVEKLQIENGMRVNCLCSSIIEKLINNEIKRPPVINLAIYHGKKLPESLVKKYKLESKQLKFIKEIDSFKTEEDVLFEKSKDYIRLSGL